MSEGITFVGMDVHKKSIHVALLLPSRTDPVEWQLDNEPGEVRKLIRRLRRESTGEIRCCYEAGPCGYALQRQIQSDRKAGILCEVIAPALIPVRPGERLKTDRRDARKLAELFRAGLLTEVHPPTEAEESVRDLCRCREDAKEDLLRAKHRLEKYLLRRGRLMGHGQRLWTARHRLWLRTLEFEHSADRAVFEDYLQAIEHLEERILTLQARLVEVAEKAPYEKPIGWLRCFRGVDTITAMTLLAEIHDFRRFATARGLMAYLGLTPSEYSSGEKRRQGSITKAGNSHARRILIEASWHYRHKPGTSRKLRQRREGQPVAMITLADRAQHRLHRRFRGLVERGKPMNKAVVAVARELTGFLWAVMHTHNMQEI